MIGEPGAADPYCDWRRISEIDEAGVLLVRPDGYVAWRVSTAVWDTEQATTLLRDALDDVLSTRTQQAAGTQPRPGTRTGLTLPGSIPESALHSRQKDSLP